MNNKITLNNIEYRQTTTCPRIYIAQDGSYIIPESNKPDLIRRGSNLYNKKKYPLQTAICTTVKYNIDNKVISKSVVKNVGRLVLDAWKNEIDESLEVDHIDRNPFNNNVDNLRLVTRTENLRNRNTENIKNNPVWLNKPEVVAKRVKTLMAKHNGTYVQPVKDITIKETFDE